MIESELAANPVASGQIGETLSAERVNVGEKRGRGLTALDRWEARRSLALHRAETERLRVLADFLARPVHAPGGSEPDPDIVTAYNLAVEAALLGIRRATFASS